MLRTLCPNLESRRIILASGSPRRKEIMDLMGLTKYEIIPSSFVEEDLSPTEFQSISDFVIAVARGKACAVFDSVIQQSPTGCIVIGADTVVVASPAGSEKHVLGKPQTPEKAMEVLKILRSARTNSVFTGVSICFSPTSCITDPKLIEFSAETKVEMDSDLMDDDALQAYVNTTEPLDKAGAYALQGIGGCFVQQIYGDMYNVVGLPMNKLFESLRRIPELLRD